jgi:CBS domain-containing protein
VRPEDSLHFADGLMTLGDLRHLPVLSEGKLVGILTHRDILRAPGLLAPVLGLGADTRAALRTLHVEEAMTTDVVTIWVEASLHEAAEQMLKHRVGCLPVMELGRLVGIVTTSDLLHAMARRREGLSSQGRSGGSLVAAPTPSSPPQNESCRLEMD